MHKAGSGKKAFELGLVDKLGFYQDAIESAADHAGLSDYQVTVVKKQLTPYQVFINDLFATYAPQITVNQNNSPMMDVYNSIMKETKTWTQLNDPVGMYLYCYECDIN